MNPSRILLACGGTGGHIYPALSLAEALKVQDDRIDIQLVGGSKELECQIFSKSGLPFHTLPIGPLQGSKKEALKTLFFFPLAFFKALFLLFKLRPKWVVGTGGYASAPLVLAAAFSGRKTCLWEANVYPGLANRWLSFFVKKSFVAFKEARSFLKSKDIEHIGFPIRQALSALSQHKPSSDFHILVMGGSQGSRKLNEVVSEMIQKYRPEGIRFLHQTGFQDYERMKEVYVQSPQVELKSYLYDISESYAWADMVVCRAGAGTLAELAAVQKPSLFIPYPWASEDHQRKNAEIFLNRKAGDMILEKDLNAETLFEKIKFFKENKEKRRQFAENIKFFHRPSVAERWAQQLLS